jgi:hypothetical protein
MCFVVVLAIIFLPVLGWAVGASMGGAATGWMGAAIGLAVAVVLVGGPTAVFLGIEKKKYDRKGRETDS